MAKVFKYGLVVFIIIALVTNNQDEFFKGIINSPFTVFDLTKTIVLSACLWNGILNIIKSSHIIDYLSFILKPLLKVIYGEVINDDLVYLYLSSNLIANLMGVGSLAIISGIKSIQTLHQKNRSNKVPSKEIMMLVVINTTGLSLVPSTMMTLRSNLGSNDIISFFKYSLIIAIIITVIGIIVVKMIDYYG